MNTDYDVTMTTIGIKIYATCESISYDHDHGHMTDQ